MTEYNWSLEDDYYARGWEEGRRIGFDEGVIETGRIYEPRLAQFWAEMQTLNARVSYLEKITSGNKDF